MQVVLVKAHIRHVGVEIDNPKRFAMDDQRHAQERVQIERTDGHAGLEAAVAVNVVAENADPFVQRPAHDGAAIGVNRGVLRPAAALARPPRMFRK